MTKLISKLLLLSGRKYSSYLIFAPADRWCNFHQWLERSGHNYKHDFSRCLVSDGIKGRDSWVEIPYRYIRLCFGATHYQDGKNQESSSYDTFGFYIQNIPIPLLLPCGLREQNGSQGTNGLLIFYQATINKLLSGRLQTVFHQIGLLVHLCR